MFKRILPIFAAILFIAGCSEPAAEKEETIVPVKIYQVMPESIEKNVKVTGIVSAIKDASVFSKISEKLTALKVKPGDRVNKDQIMAIQYNLLLKQSVEMAEAALRSAQAQKSLAEQEFARMKKLYDQRAVSQQQFDQVKTQSETASIAVEQASTQLAQSREQYENSFIKSPFDGVVAAVYFEKDQMIPAGQPVIKIISPNAMKGKLRVSAKDLSLLKIGQDVKINFPAIPNQSFHGSVNRIDQAFDPVSKSLEVEVQINDADQTVKSGMFGEFLITTEIFKDAVVIPEAALMQQTEVVIDRSTGVQKPVKKYFTFKTVDGYAKLSEVKIGISSNGRIKIESGISIGDSIVVVGQNVVREGQKVKVIN